MAHKRLKGASRMGDFDSIDESGQTHAFQTFALYASMDQVAETIVRMNYGTHRLLSSLVRARRELLHPDDELAQRIEDLLNEGYW